MINNFINTVYFVYVGYPLPKYAVSSIKLAKEFSGMKIHILTNSKNYKFLNTIVNDFTALEDFYQSKSLEISKKIISSTVYDENFWVKTVERYFVLYDYFKRAKINSFFHAELDQLLFRTDLLVENILKTQQKGIFIPYQNKNSVVASVLFCNEITALESLLHEAKSGKPYISEMDLIANWSNLNPSLAISLPTLASKIIRKNIATPNKIFELGAEELGGIVDAAQLGHWVGGIDPKLIPIYITPKTKFVAPKNNHYVSKEILEKINFQIDVKEKKLQITYNGDKFNVFNIHLHSKIHQSLIFPKNSMVKLFKLANKKKAVHYKITKIIQLNIFYKKILQKFKNSKELKLSFLNKLNFFKKKINLFFDHRPSSYPHISGDTFRKIANFVWENNNMKINLQDIKAGDIIFCESDCLSEINNLIINKINVPVILLLGNSDINFSFKNFNYINRNKVFDIYAQNLVDKIDDWKVLPIGLENLWHSKNGKLSKKITIETAETQKIYRVMQAFNIDTNINDRSIAAKDLMESGVADKISYTYNIIYQQHLKNYAFIASPPGNGIDTHRIWEAFHFNCVPVVLKSHMTLFYEAIGLPIWVLNNYAELKEFDENMLRNKYLNLVNKFKSEAIWAQYWIKKIFESSKFAKINFHNNHL
jgi:hypothetical protein